MNISFLFDPMNLTLIILACSIFFFVWGAVRSDLVALCSLLALTLTNIITPVEALKGFASPITVMMIGIFVVGTAIFRTGLAKMIGSRILRLAGSSENKLFVLIMLVTASVGGFVSNTGTVAMMLPIVVSMANSANINPRRYLMPLAFASSMGYFTLISTSPNLVIQNIIIENGFEPLAFFAFAPIGFICLGIGVVTLFFLSRLFIIKDDGKNTKKKQSLADLAEKYNLGNQTYRIAVKEDSPIPGKTLAELQISNLYNINVNKISRRASNSRFSRIRNEHLAWPNSRVEKEDILYCQGTSEDIKHFAEDKHLTILKEHDKKAFVEFRELGIAEIYVLPTSKLVNRTISEVHFRETYHVSILGISRKGEFLVNGLNEAGFEAGDALLVQGTWNDLANLDEDQTDLVLVGQPLKEASKVTLDSKAPVAAIIMVLMIIAMVFNILEPVTAVLSAAVIMVITGCLRNMEEAYNGINWQSVLLIAGMMPMATAFEKTGITVLISDGLITYLGGMGPYAILAGIYLCTSVLTMFISNTATAILLAPIAVHAAITMGVSPYPLMLAVSVGASMCFASPFSTPPNAIVMAAGRYSFMDYIKVGLPVQVIIAVVMIFALPLLFPF